ncbi:MAG TPA: hypothetical protein VK912_04950 [Longimicrobiales bacterium]|nr:hypothetical protein [Longimicrobiales bacterium]
MVTTPHRAFAWTLAAVLMLVVPDGRAIAVAAYAPMFLLGAPFDWPPGSFWQEVTWPIWNQYLCVLGGALWASTALGYSRRAAGRCVRCGRDPLASEACTRTIALRLGRQAVAVAMIAPLPYAATRLAWAFGIPVGMPADVLTAIRESGSAFPAAGLAAVAMVGALLTLGLVQPWGEAFPAWVPRLGGRRLPPAIAVVPAGIVAVLVFGAGRGVARDWIEARLRGDAGSAMDLVGLVWPVWGLALGVAAWAYHIRRRRRCRACGGG